MRRFSPASSLYHTSSLSGALGVMGALLLSTPAQAVPTIPAAVPGQTALTPTSGTVTQTTNKAVVNWQGGFNVGNGQSINIHAPSPSITLERDVSGNTTQILGSLNSNGKIMIVNAPVSVPIMPSDPTVVAGQSSFSHPSANEMVQTQTSDKAIVNWQGGFDIGEGGTFKIVAPSASSTTLERDVSGNMSNILGTLDANDHVMIENGAGVFFGKNSHVVNVAGLIVSTHDISDQNFMAGHYLFDQSGNPNASIVNEGTITATDGGLVALVAPNVVNDGVITAHKGEVVLASGEQPTIDLYGDGLYSFALGSGDASGSVKNTGTIDATGGTVLMTVAAADQVVNQAIDTSGIVTADNITLDAKTGDVTLGGTLDASSAPNGGDINVYSNNLSFTPGAKITAGQGGKVLLDPTDVTIDSTAATTIDNTLNTGSDVNFSATGSITDAANISKTAGGDASLTLTAGNNITVNTGIGISSSSGKLNTELNSDTSGTGGYINMGIGSFINSNGGNITLHGGGTGGAAQSADDNFGGITLGVSGNGGATINAAGGNITMIGAANSNSGAHTHADGIDLFKGSVVETSGTGTIAMTGTGSTGQTTSPSSGTWNSDGVYIGTATVTAQNGDISITGTGKGTTDNTAKDWGTQLLTSSNINTTGTGNISITGTGAPGAAGIMMTSSTAPNGGIGGGQDNGNITFTGNGGITLASNILTSKDITFNSTGDMTYQNAAANAGGNINLTSSNLTLSSANMSATNALTANTGNVTLTGSSLSTSNGALAINNTGVFNNTSGNAALFNKLTLGTGSVSLNQNTGGSIQNAVNSIGSTGQGGATLTLGNGTWTESPTVNRSNAISPSLVIKGQGAANTLIKAASGSNAVFTVNNSPNVTLSGMTIDGQNSAAGIAYLNSGGEVKNVTITNATGEGTGAPNTVGGAIWGNDTNGGAYTIAVDGIALNNFSQDGILFYGAGLTGNVHDNTITGLGASAAGQQVGIEFGDNAAGSIANNALNNFRSANNGAIGISNAGVVTADHNTINDIDTAIFVLNTPGAVITNNTINGAQSGISVMGNSPGGNVIGNQITIAPKGVGINIGSDGGVISNNVLTGAGGNKSSGYMGSNETIGIIASANNLLVDHNTIDEATTGISALNYNQINVTNNTLSNVNVGIQGAAFGDAIANLNISGNTITNASITNNGTTGISLDNVKSTSVLDNTIAGFETGINVDGEYVTSVNGGVLQTHYLSDTVLIGDGTNPNKNTISNVNTGVSGSNTVNLFVQGNSLTGAGAGTGVTASGDKYLTVSGNGISGFTTTGISVDSTAGSNITNNTLTGSPSTTAATGISLGAGDTFANVTGNTIQATTTGIAAMGTYITNINHNTINNSSLTLSSGSAAISLNDTKSTTVLANTIGANNAAPNGFNTGIAVTGDAPVSGNFASDTISIGDGTNANANLIIGTPSNISATNTVNLFIDDNQMNGGGFGTPGIAVSGGLYTNIIGNQIGQNIKIGSTIYGGSFYNNDISVSNSAGTNIANNTIFGGNLATGVALNAGDTFTSVTGNTITAGANGISANGALQTVIGNNTITGTSQAGSSGVALNNSKSTSLLGNTVSGFDTGIKITGDAPTGGNYASDTLFIGDGTTPNKNTMSNVNTGIDAGNTVSLYVLDNTLAGSANGTNGIVANNNKFVTFSNNTISGFATTGINESGTPGAFISGNGISGAATGIAIGAGGPGTYVTGNVIDLAKGNTGNTVSVTPTGTGISMAAGNDLSFITNNGITATGGTPGATGISVDGNNGVTVDGNTVSNMATGVSLTNGDLNHVTSNQISNVNTGISGYNIGFAQLDSNTLSAASSMGTVGVLVSGDPATSGSNYTTRSVSVGSNSITGFNTGVSLQNVDTANVGNNPNGVITGTTANIGGDTISGATTAGISATNVINFIAVSNTVNGSGTGAGTGITLNNAKSSSLWSNQVSGFNTGVSVTGTLANDTADSVNIGGPRAGDGADFGGNTLHNVANGIVMNGVVSPYVNNNTINGTSLSGGTGITVSGSQFARIASNTVDTFNTGIISSNNISGTVIGDTYGVNNITNVVNGIVAQNDDKLVLDNNSLTATTQQAAGTGIDVTGSTPATVPANIGTSNTISGFSTSCTGSGC